MPHGSLLETGIGVSEQKPLKSSHRFPIMIGQSATKKQNNPMNISNVAPATNTYQPQATTTTKRKQRADNDGDADDGGAATAASTATEASEATAASKLNVQA